MRRRRSDCGRSSRGCRRTTPPSSRCATSRAGPPSEVCALLGLTPRTSACCTRACEDPRGARDVLRGGGGMSEPASDCRQVTELVTDYVEGALPTEERARVRAARRDLPALPRGTSRRCETVVRVAGSLREDDLPENVRESLVERVPRWKAGATDARATSSSRGRPRAVQRLRVAAARRRRAGCMGRRESVDECFSGVHAAASTDLLDWIDDELWLVELAGAIRRAVDGRRRARPPGAAGRRVGCRRCRRVRRRVRVACARCGGPRSSA